MARNLLAETPAYPWDALQPIRDLAASHPDGMVDLSIGSPVDPVPQFIQTALHDGGDAHAYTTAAGVPELKDAIVGWYRRRRGVALRRKNVMPSIGSKEFIAQLALWMGLDEHDTVVQPTVHYPTYAVGANLTGAQLFSGNDPATWPDSTRLIWLNSPGNPDGVVNTIEYLRAAVARAQELGALIVQDECYAELGWDAPWDVTPVPSILDPRVVAGSMHNVLSIYSLSKQSNLAGYRAGIVAGCGAVIGSLVNLRKQLGLSVPAPIQAAMTAALGDDDHVRAQKHRYALRRAELLPAARAWGLQISDADVAGLYLWGTRHESSEATMRALAQIGILGGPGTFYGDAGAQYVRLSLTASDADIAAAAARLRAV